MWPQHVQYFRGHITGLVFTCSLRVLNSLPVLCSHVRCECFWQTLNPSGCHAYLRSTSDSVWIDVFRACIPEARFTLELKVLYEGGNGKPVCAVSLPGSWSGATWWGILRGRSLPTVQVCRTEITRVLFSTSAHVEVSGCR